MDLRALRGMGFEPLKPSRERQVWYWAGGVLALFLVLFLGFSPLVCALAEAQGRARGLTLSIDKARPGFGALWLLGVEAAPEGIPSVQVHLDAVRVGLGFALGPRSLEISGGSIQAEGSLEELRDKFKAWRASEPAGKERAGARRTPIKVRGLDLAWRESAARSGNAQYVWGIALDREENGDVTLGADLAHLNRDAIGLEITRPELTAVATEAGRRVRGVKAEALIFHARLATRSTEDAAESEKAEDPDNPEDDAKTAPEAGFLALKPARPQKLRAALRTASELVAKTIEPGGSLEFTSVSFKVERGSETLNLGPSLVRVARSPQKLEVSVVPSSAQAGSGTELRLRATLPLEAGEAQLELDGGPVSLASLGIREGDFGLSGVDRARLLAGARVSLSEDAETVRFSGSGKLDALSLERPELSSQPLTGIHLLWRSEGSFAVDGSRLKLDDSELGLGAARFYAQADIERGDDYSRLKLKASVPLSPCQALYESVPRGAVPLLGSLKLSGTFAFNGEVVFNSKTPKTTVVRFAPSNRCKITQIPKELSPERFTSSWTREVKGADGKPMEIESGPETDSWVPYDAISPFMETALLVCEDGRFFRHHGFDYSAIESAIRDDLSAGRFKRGASTLSMQLAKNLYLTREKTLSRKLQEAVMTMLLEQELEKPDLLELYLNVVEFGPGIYGIGPAASYYFDARPIDLTLAQALYLGSILPKPDRSHFAPDGTLRPAWQTYLQKLMRIARERERITDEELEAGLEEELVFHSAPKKATPLAGTPPSARSLREPPRSADRKPETKALAAAAGAKSRVPAPGAKPLPAASPPVKAEPAKRKKTQ